MKHKAIAHVIERAELAQTDSDTSYWMSLLYLGEAVFKSITACVVSAISDAQDRNRYRLEYNLIRASGIGQWKDALEDALTGPASQFIIDDARIEQREITQKVKSGDWRYEAVRHLQETLEIMEITCDPMPQKCNLLRWFTLFSTLRNKTRGHGAPASEKCSAASVPLRRSIDIIVENSTAISRPWVYLHQNLSGKYRVSEISGDCSPFDRYKSATGANLPNGIYVFIAEPVRVDLIESSPELRDFFFANGGYTEKKYDCISYFTGATFDGDSEKFKTPPGRLPGSETEGAGHLDEFGKCFANVPEVSKEYISRSELEEELISLLLNDRHPLITLVGRGGIGKTSLSLATLPKVAEYDRFDAIIWFSSRDIDLKETGPKPVRPHILTENDVSDYFSELISPSEAETTGATRKEFFERALSSSPLGPTLFVFDNFETTSSPADLYKWIDTYIRLPNKVLITTRLREFRGDYPIEVKGMTEPQSRELISATADALGVQSILTDSYVESLVTESQGHPYVIKILLGEVAKEKKAVNVRLTVAGNEEILTALFERTYAALSEAARRVFLTLASWNSAVPKLALEAILLRPGNERSDVDEAVDSLLTSSMIEDEAGESEGQMVLTVPLAAREFGRKKLNVTHLKTVIEADREILLMLGVQKTGEQRKLGFHNRVVSFFRSVAKQIDCGKSTIEDYLPILEMMARNYHPAWIDLSDLHVETLGDMESGKEYLRRYLENETGPGASEAWRSLAFLCYQTGDTLGEIHALIERAQLSFVPFEEISETANRFNKALHDGQLELELEERNFIGNRLLQVLERRKLEAKSNDFSRMAWLALNLKQEARAATFVESGLDLDPYSKHLLRLKERLGV